MRFFFVQEGVFIFLIIAVVVLAFSPLLFFNKVFFDEEQFGFYYPQSFFYQKEMLRGGDLVWNNSYYAGVPVGFDQFLSPHYPLHKLLFRWFDFFEAHHLSIVLAVAAGCLLTYWFGRANDFYPISAFVLSTSYLFATSFGWLDIGTLAAHAFLVTPGLLLALLKISRDDHPFLFAVLGGVVLGIGFLAGFMQIIFYIYTVAFLYALFLCWQGWNVYKGWRRIKVLLGLVLITFIALLVGGQQILPSVFLIDLSIRTPTYAIQHIVPSNPAQFITFLFPEYIKLPRFGGGSDGFYLGALGFLAAIFTLVAHRTRSSLFFLGAYGIVLGFAFHVPVFSWINEHLPPFSRMGENFRWMLAGSFPLAYLSAYGMEGILRGNTDRKKINLFLRVSGWAVCGAVLLVIFTNLFLYVLVSRPDLQEKFLQWYVAARFKSLPLESYRPVLAQILREAEENFFLFDWRVFLPVGLLVSVYFLFRYFGEGKMPLHFFKRLAVAFVVLNLTGVYFAQYKKGLVSEDLYTKEPLLAQEIKKRESDPNTYRIAGFAIGDALFWELLSKRMPPPPELAVIQRELMVSDSNVFYGLQRIDGLEPYRTLRHNQILNTVIFPSGLRVFNASSSALATSKLDKLYNEEVWKPATPAEKIKDFLEHIPLLSSLNVKYIYSLVPLPDARLTEIKLPANSLLPFPLYLYENKDFMPRIYFAKNPLFFSGRDIDLLVKMTAVRDFAKETLIECKNGCTLPVKNGKNSVRARHYENGLVELETLTEKGGWLVFGESFMPGWTATIDGEQTEIYPADYILQSIYIPAGKHEVKFKYVDIVKLKWQQLKKKVED